MKWDRGLLSFQRYLLKRDRYETVPASTPAWRLVDSTSTTTRKSVASPCHFQREQKRKLRVRGKTQNSYSVQCIDHGHRETFYR